jgi:RNA polymerase sigma factor (TIGR02999 family)
MATRGLRRPRGRAGALTESGSKLTKLLRAWNSGDAGARDELVPLVYEQLRRQAARHLRSEAPGHSLTPTALVHEAFLRLVDADVTWKDRAHFFGIASRLMRQILVDHARAARAQKRGHGWCRLSLHEDRLPEQRDEDLLALDEVLTQLEALDPDQARVVELRFFGGLSVEETAEALGVSTATVKREWSLARAWLFQRIRTTTSPDTTPAGRA